MEKSSFNDLKIRTLKVESGRKDFYDPSFNYGGSFGIRVSSTGKKSFFLAYRYRGQRRRYSLGDYPVISLKKAREKAIQVLAQLVDGEDPSARRRQKKLASTFTELAEEYIAIRSLDGPNQKRIAKSSIRGYCSMLTRDVLPAIGNYKSEDVTPEQILTLMDEIAIKRNAPISANRTFELIRQIYNWGMSWLIVKMNPCQSLKSQGKNCSA